MIFPAVLEDGCSQEDCDFDLKAIACEPMELRAATADGAAVVHRIMRKESLTVDSTRIVLTRPGVVVVRRRLDVKATQIGESRGGTHHFAAGDTLLLIEGYESDVGNEWQWWRHGHVETGFQFWPEPGSADTASAAAIQLARPVHETWLRITPSRGTAGWWRLQQRDRAAFEPAHGTGAEGVSCLG